MSSNDSYVQLQQQVDFRLMVDLKDLAQQIEMQFHDLLEPPPVGIYTANTIDPVMVDGQRYYTRHKVDNLAIDFIADQRAKRGLIESAQYGGDVLVEIDDINKIERAVFNADGKCVIPAAVMKQRARLVSNLPLQPYRGILIAVILFRYRVDHVLRWPHPRMHLTSRLQEHFVEGAYNNDDLEDIIHPFYMAVGDYTSELTHRHEWCIYHFKRSNSVLTIERGIDWRILEWTRQQEEKAEAEQQRA